MRYPALLILFLLIACNGNKTSDPALDDVTQEVPITEIPDAPADQVAALTDTVSVDSTDMNRNYKYEGSYIYISKSKMRLYVLSANDSVLFSCGIACGLRRGDKQEREDYRTPEGHFRISGIFESTDWIHRRKDGREVKGCYGPYFLRLATGRFSGIGIHGTNAPGSIGHRASEGCIRVNSKNIVILHDHFAYNGMPVIVAGEMERLPDFEGMGEEIRSAEAMKRKLEADSLQRAALENAEKVEPAEPDTAVKGETVGASSDSVRLAQPEDTLSR